VSAADPVKIERYRERLREECTEDATVAAWRKWQAKLSAYTRGATDAILFERARVLLLGDDRDRPQA